MNFIFFPIGNRVSKLIMAKLNVIGLYHTGLETQLSTQEASKSFVEIKLQSCESLLSQTQDKVKSLESEQQKLLSEKKEMVDTEKDLTTKLKEANKQVSETCLWLAIDSYLKVMSVAY